MTAIRCTINPAEVEVLVNGIVVSTMDMERLCALDSDLRDCVCRAQECRGECVPVPTKSFAKGNRNRNYGALCIQ